MTTTTLTEPISLDSQFLGMSPGAPESHVMGHDFSGDATIRCNFGPSCVFIDTINGRIILVFNKPSGRIQVKPNRAAVPVRPRRRGCRETRFAGDCFAVTL